VNHLVNANKKVGDTPRIDSIKDDGSWEYQDMVYREGQKLERELIKSIKQIKQLKYEVAVLRWYANEEAIKKADESLNKDAKL
jgi:hypothetical protein